MSITTKDETISKMSRSTDDRERTLRTQLSELQSKTKHRVADLTSQVEQLQAEVSRRMLEAEGLTESLSALTKANNENKVCSFFCAIVPFSLFFPRLVRLFFFICFNHFLTNLFSHLGQFSSHEVTARRRARAEPGTQGQSTSVPGHPQQGEQAAAGDPRGHGG